MEYKMVRRKKKVLKRKHTYWHQLAKIMLGFGFKPTMVGHILKDVFPETEVNGRHVGAYKRRLIQDDELIVPEKATMSRNEASQLAPELVSTEDMFIYKCTVGSAKKSLECFQFKFKAEDVSAVEEVEEWITAIQ
jgi:hypothetical protein|tara:strand:+ start:107 stop:511 length:405 start_codon:yes stop_codon:yes gene_type:complete